MKNSVKNTEDKLQNEQKKCFVIMPISDQGDYPKGHFTKVVRVRENRPLRVR